MVVSLSLKKNDGCPHSSQREFGTKILATSSVGATPYDETKINVNTALFSYVSIYGCVRTCVVEIMEEKEKRKYENRTGLADIGQQQGRKNEEV